MCFGAGAIPVRKLKIITPWWNSGASHLNQVLAKKFFDRLGLVSLMDQYHRLKCDNRIIDFMDGVLTHDGQQQHPTEAIFLRL
jgi:hypothetical protein